MNIFKKNLVLILLITALSGCTTRTNLNDMPSSSGSVNKTSESEKELNDELKLNKKDVQANNKTSSDLAANAEKVKPSSTTNSNINPNSSNLPKSNNNPKKIIAQAPKNKIPPTKPQVAKTVQKVQIQTPPVQNNSTTVQNNQQVTSQQENTANKDTTSTIPGLPPINYEVNSYEGYYNAIYDSLKDFQGSVYIKLDNYSDSLYNLDVIDAITNDNYDVDYGLKSVGAQLFSMGNINILNVQFNYGYSRDKLLTMRDSAQAKAGQIIAQIIKPGMSDLDKEKVIHDYIVLHTAYDYTDYVNGSLPGTAFNDYGVLINGSAVCEGYSKAMLKLMRMAGLQAKSVIGYGLDGTSKIPHAWNMVKINGVYTMVDATWDDPVPNEKDKVYYNYFDVSDADLAKDHQWDMSKYPKTSSVVLNISNNQ